MRGLRNLLRNLLLLALWAPALAWGQVCNYSVSPNLNFGSIVGLPTPQIDVSATITVSCPALSLRKVCIGMPVGGGGITTADRRLVNGGSNVQFQIYRNAARTQVWGTVSQGLQAESSQLIGLTPIVFTVYGRVFSGQSGQSVGVHQSVFSNIEGREGLTLLTACSAMGTVFSLPGSMTAQLQIEPDCTISANPLDFGTVTSIVQTDASSNLSVNCTLNGAYSVSLDGGTTTGNVGDRKMELGANTVDYQLYRDAARTLVWGNTPGTTVDGTGSGAPQSITVYGRVPAQGPKPPGTYQDTITATVTF